MLSGTKTTYSFVCPLALALIAFFVDFWLFFKCSLIISARSRYSPTFAFISFFDFSFFSSTDLSQ